MRKQDHVNKQANNSVGTGRKQCWGGGRAAEWQQGKEVTGQGGRQEVGLWESVGPRQSHQTRSDTHLRMPQAVTGASGTLQRRSARRRWDRSTARLRSARCRGARGTAGAGCAARRAAPTHRPRCAPAGWREVSERSTVGPGNCGLPQPANVAYSSGCHMHCRPADQPTSPRLSTVRCSAGHITFHLTTSPPHLQLHVLARRHHAPHRPHFQQLLRRRRRRLVVVAAPPQLAAQPCRRQVVGHAEQQRLGAVVAQQHHLARLREVGRLGGSCGSLS